MEVRLLQMQNILHKQEEKLNHVQKFPKKLAQVQSDIFQKQKEFQEFKKDGSPKNPIKGHHNLPIYGSMKAEPHIATFSCLANIDYSITQASETWNIPLLDAYICRNLAISTRRFAFRRRFCDTFISGSACTS